MSDSNPERSGSSDVSFDAHIDGRPDPGADAPTFEAPWQARAFALAVALTDEDDLPWDEFQSRLVEAVDEDVASGNAGEEAYYRQWLTALERLLVERDLLAPGELTERVASFDAGDRSAHEFVEGDPRGHTDKLPEGHAEGGGHDHGEDGHHHSHGEHSEHNHGHGDHDTSGSQK